MSNSNYVAAWADWKNEKIVVLERDSEGVLSRKLYNPPYYFYVQDEEGDCESIFGDRLTKIELDSREQYNAAKQQFNHKFESDIAPLKRVLMDNYYNKPAPLVHFAFLDIEVDYTQKIGFADPKNPYAPINAVTIYQSWTKRYFTFVVAPPKFSGTEATIHSKLQELIKAKQLREDRIPLIKICRDELELLMEMVKVLDDADIISGWNSEFFDIPYICERLLLNGGEHLLSRLDWHGVRLPKQEMVNRFGSEEPIWKFTGKSHLDYMRLFQKFTFEGRVSYSLGNILQEEVSVGKIEYDGTLEQLYHNDFPTFVCYNFRDVDGIVQLDEKFKFIALTNQMAHENTVLFDVILGTVAYVETGIANFAHYELNKVVHDKVIKSHDKVEGAIVLTPTPGLYEWTGSVDLKSQYPNTIRSLNISPEMIVGQFTAYEDAWKCIREGRDTRLTLTLENGEQIVATASEWKRVLGEQKWAVSAYGTVFDQGRGQGVVAALIGFWYNERKRLQAEQKKWAKKYKSLPDGPEKEEAKRQEEHYDLLQLTKKIAMNSLYGALLNVAFRFGDARMGASVTATGRAITTHMHCTIEELVTGVKKQYAKVEGKPDTAGNGDEYDRWFYITRQDQLEKLRADKKLANPNYQLPDDFVDFEAVIYGDTDSCYFKTFGTDKTSAIEIADQVTELLNNTFPGFMKEAFSCQPGFDSFISAGREIVGLRGLFQAKKKYTIKIADKEGMTPEPGKDIKSQGSEIKKADTPKIIQKFLKILMDKILTGAPYSDLATFVNQQRKELVRNPDNTFAIGVAKQVNNLDKYLAEYNVPGSMIINGRALTIPGHARAALNYNSALNIYDKGSKLINSGDKVLVFYLKSNQHDFDSIAFPAEFTKFPKWFVENFQVDIKKTESKMIDNKLKGIFNALHKDVPSPQSVYVNAMIQL